jgi:hypothetical protein
MEWEKPYLEALIDALRPSGEVLEVGFGLGYAAAHIQTYAPKKHTIIEQKPAIAQQAIQWAKNHPGVSVIEDTWQNALANLSVFDAIFFNASSLENIGEVVKCREMGNNALHREKELFSMINKQLPQLTTIRYSDEDLHEFYEQVGKLHLKEVGRFLYELKSSQQISEDQYEKMIQTYSLEKDESKSNLLTERDHLDPSFEFFESCLNKHMRKGSRFSCFSSSPASKYENPQFFEHVITNPNLDYQEKLIPIAVPQSCEYYPFDEALVMVIEKLV